MIPSWIQYSPLGSGIVLGALGTKRKGDGLKDREIPTRNQQKKNIHPQPQGAKPKNKEEDVGLKLDDLFGFH